jgi:Zn-finger nucleic acid-binding protein
MLPAGDFDNAPDHSDARKNGACYLFASDMVHWRMPVPEPVAFHCPNCGAATPPDSTRCAYCLSTLATEICAECFGAVFVGMKHCPWCGKESGSAQPRTEGGLNCPRCAKPLASLSVNGRPLSRCTKCGGLWVDSKTTQEICAGAEDQEAVLAMDRGASPPARSSNGPARTYVPCPVCSKLMNRTNFAGCSGVVVDCCKPHGNWFDKEELRRVVEFVRTGGLKKSRERQIERLKQESERLKDEQKRLMRLSRLVSSLE